MKTIVSSPTGWQVDDRPLWARIRRWVVSLAERELRNGRLSNEGTVLPMSFFGVRVVLAPGRFQVRTPWGFVVVAHKGRKGSKKRGMGEGLTLDAVLFGLVPGLSQILERNLALGAVEKLPRRHFGEGRFTTCHNQCD